MVVALAVALAVWASPVAPALAAAQDEHNAPDQTIDPDQEVVDGPATLDLGHVDLGPRLVDGSWSLMVHDDTVEPSVWRPLDEVVVAVPDAAVVEVPDDERYAFLGLDPGTPVHVIPQTQDPDVVWLGWNTQAPDVLEGVDRGVTMSLVGLEGPGDLTVYLQAGTMEPPDVLWRSSDDEPSPLFVDVNTHTHANWLFSEPGVYLARIQVDAELIDGTIVTDTATLRFAVGDGVDPEEAGEAEYAGTDATVGTGAGAAADGEDGEDGGGGANGDDGGSLGVAAALVGAAVVLAVGAVVVIRRNRQVRRAAEDASVGAGGSERDGGDR